MGGTQPLSLREGERAFMYSFLTLRMDLAVLWSGLHGIINRDWFSLSLPFSPPACLSLP
jgi:hypothetical protein